MGPRTLFQGLAVVRMAAKHFFHAASRATLSCIILGRMAVQVFRRSTRPKNSGSPLFPGPCLRASAAHPPGLCLPEMEAMAAMRPLSTAGGPPCPARPHEA
eukprot:2478334-Pyramimonas_sp.AAC.1